jgi:hypothetical protein
MCLQCCRRKNAWVRNRSEGNQSKLRHDKVNHHNGRAFDKKGGSEAYRRIAALNRFISKSVERSLPFFRALKSTEGVEWGPEQCKAFQQLKAYLAKNLEVTTPNPEAQLLLYVAASDHAVSRVLVQEEEEDAKVLQKLVYYISEALSGAKLNYSEIEKIAYAILTASRKLKHYFQAHKVIVPWAQPLNDIFSNKEASGRIGKWATELSQFNLEFVPRTAIKSHISRFHSRMDAFAIPPAQRDKQEWTIYSDGAWGHLGAGAAAVLTSPSGQPLK